MNVEEIRTASLYIAILGSWHIGIILQLTLLDDILSTRGRHSVTAIPLAPGLIEVTMFGGTPHFVPNQHEIQSIAATTIITFSELNQHAYHDIVYREGVFSFVPTVIGPTNLCPLIIPCFASLSAQSLKRTTHLAQALRIMVLPLSNEPDLECMMMW